MADFINWHLQDDQRKQHFEFKDYGQQEHVLGLDNSKRNCFGSVQNSKRLSVVIKLFSFLYFSFFTFAVVTSFIAGDKRHWQMQPEEKDYHRNIQLQLNKMKHAQKINLTLQKTKAFKFLS